MAEEDTKPAEPFKAPAPAPTPAPKVSAPAPAGNGARTVAIKDILGQDAGFTIELGPEGEAQEGDELGVQALADRVKGWSNFYLDGKEFPYSSENARALLARFGYIREQLTNPE